MTWFFVLVLGALGTGLRFGLDQLLSMKLSNCWIITLVINLMGCFILGFLVEIEALKTPDLAPLRIGLIIGLCGGFTTFSALSMNLFKFLENGELFKATSYGAGSLILGVIALYLGMLSYKTYLN